MRVIAAILAMILSAVVFGEAQACKVFPERYRVSHKELVSRTDRIALVQVLQIEVNARTGTGKVIFEPVEVLKGEFSDTIELKHYAWIYGVPESASSDFNRHRDPEFWPSTAQYMSANRSLGVGTDCEMEFYFAPGSRYLGFFEGRRPQHIHSFELIIHDDDAWLQKVRELVAE